MTAFAATVSKRLFRLARIPLRVPRVLPEFAEAQPRQPLEPLVIDETLHVDETAIDREEWLVWAQRNLTAREAELMRLAIAADVEQPADSVAARC